MNVDELLEKSFQQIEALKRSNDISIGEWRVLLNHHHFTVVFYAVGELQSVSIKDQELIVTKLETLKSSNDFDLFGRLLQRKIFHSTVIDRILALENNRKSLLQIFAKYLPHKYFKKQLVTEIISMADIDSNPLKELLNRKEIVIQLSTDHLEALLFNDNSSYVIPILKHISVKRLEKYWEPIARVIDKVKFGEKIADILCKRPDVNLEDLQTLYMIINNVQARKRIQQELSPATGRLILMNPKEIMHHDDYLTMQEIYDWCVNRSVEIHQKLSGKELEEYEKSIENSFKFDKRTSSFLTFVCMISDFASNYRDEMQENRITQVTIKEEYVIPTIRRTHQKTSVFKYIFKHLPPDLSNLQCLSSVKIEKIALEELSVTSLPSSLETLHIVDDTYQPRLHLQIDPLVFALPNFTKLHISLLSNSILPSIPMHLLDSLKIQYINIFCSTDQHISLPVEYFFAPRIKSIRLRGDIDIQHFNFGEELSHRMSSLEDIQIVENSISTLQHLINHAECFPNLRNLIIVRTKLIHIPPGLSNFSQLERLTIRDHQLEGIPMDLTELTGLRYLELEANNLQYDHPVFTNLINRAINNEREFKFLRLCQQNTWKTYIDDPNTPPLNNKIDLQEFMNKVFELNKRLIIGKERHVSDLDSSSFNSMSVGQAFNARKKANTKQIMLVDSDMAEELLSNPGLDHYREHHSELEIPKMNICGKELLSSELSKLVVFHDNMRKNYLKEVKNIQNTFRLPVCFGGEYIRDYIDFRYSFFC